MLRIIHAGTAIPYSMPVDPSAEFEPGQVGQLYGQGSQIVGGVSDGSAPFGIIDDLKKNSFSAVSVDEVIIVPAEGILNSQNVFVSKYDIKTELKNPNITAGSFTSDVDVELFARNGVIKFLAGTPLNFSIANNGIADAFRAVVSYRYQVPNVPGDDSTLGNGRVTLWFQKMIVQTDQFETNQRYAINAPLFVSESGLFTTRQCQPGYPSIGFVTAPPAVLFASLELMWQ